MKKGANKLMRANYNNCSVELFAVFANERRSAWWSLRGCRSPLALFWISFDFVLQVDAIVKNLRYGGQMGLGAGSLSAKIDDEGCISLCIILDFI